CVVLSLNVPMALNCWVVPGAIEPEAGVTTVETSVAPLTVRLVEPVTDPRLAEIVPVPAVMLATNPPAETVATPVLLELQTTYAVRSRVLLSLNVPIAVNC